MKPLYVAGTKQHVGKTTLSIGLVHAFRQRGMKVAYAKPLGQRLGKVRGHLVHEDALIMTRLLGDDSTLGGEMAVPLPKGRVEQKISHLDIKALSDKVNEGLAPLWRTHDLVVVEGMGHVAAGSCLGLSSAEVARSVGARVLLITGGGIGRAIDDIALCGGFMMQRGADIMGGVVNKVWPEKFERVKQATTKGLQNIQMRSWGTVPFQQELASPTVGQVHDLLGGEIIAGQDKLEIYVRTAIVAAMESSHMVRYLTSGTLVITPGDRSDNILAAISTNKLSDPASRMVAGMILTGGFRPDGTLMRLMSDAHLPVILVKDDTYTVASKFRETIFKIQPDDEKKIQLAMSLAAEYLDIDGILESLE